jgi:hypothetical protein
MDEFLAPEPYEVKEHRKGSFRDNSRANSRYGDIFLYDERYGE